MPNGYLHARRRRRSLIALSVTVATAAGGTAALLWAWPDGSFTFTAGPGHGRGMSQTGAFDRSVGGDTADTILAHYYPGAELADIGPTTVRVRLQAQDDSTLDVISESVFYVAGRRVIPGQAAVLTPTPTGADVRITQGCDGETLWEGSTDDPWAYPSMEGTNRPAAEHLQLCGGSAYRGVLGVALENGKYRTVNDVDVDDYLMGVVPAEMVPNWADQGGSEALRAQAIAARSYALAEHRYAYAETCDTTDCQMYPGTDKEDTRTTDAVLATSGRVLSRDNHVLRAEYSASPDGGTPAENLEIGPALSDFPAAQPALPSFPLFPDLLNPNPSEPSESDPAAPTYSDPTYSDPTYTDPTYSDQTYPDQTDSYGVTPTPPIESNTPTEIRPHQNPGTRVRNPLPPSGSTGLPAGPTTLRLLANSHRFTDPTPETTAKPPLPNTIAPSTASTPTPPSAPQHPAFTTSAPANPFP
ncbi:SpoIID/LytB domain-containing protein [Nocardia yamanashiensis]|uniref:SpoIID/LytB domain-containing protein n=1 Tax=Nocardia yamanashiensis TaxID=209247 RepID=UPI001E3989E2|nr:SpoIID/LytB domain-containing protein [Nocardia yamanashiensis]UGT40387.1 SpoIID/LytB domain-containing protein [Nocardia yamanashiensis]